jgi:FKBP-type peptidyl-prolyl cis-trans isomerase SlyD
MMTADGYRISGIVLQVTADKVKMDFNHPLAGKDIRFKGHIITVRQATPEELQPSCGCGGGCGGGCGDGGCNCGDGGCK